MSTRHLSLTPWYESPACAAARALPRLRVGDAYRWQHTTIDARTCVKTTHTYRLEHNDFIAGGALQRIYVLTRDAVPVWRSADPDAVLQQLATLGFSAPVRIRTFLVYLLRNERLRALPWHGRTPHQMARQADAEQRRARKAAENHAYRQRKRAAQEVGT